MRFQLETVGRPPSHWNRVRNKTLFQGIDDRSDDGSEELLTVSHLTGVTRRAEKDVYMFMAESLEGYKRCQPGDLVINTMWAWMGALGISPHNGVVSPSYHVYRPARRDVEPRYFDYLFRTKAYVAEITRNSRGVWTSRLRLYPDVFLDMESLLPPPDDQIAIAEFLDRKTAAIDALIEKKERLVALLAEKRAALIHRAVTRGLDPDAPMKQSGVPWIGEIPRHWAVARLSFRYEQQLGKMLNPDAAQGDQQFPYLANKDVQWDRVRIDDLSTMSFSPAERLKFELRGGDLLVCEGGEVGRTAVWRGELSPCYFQKAVHRLRPFDLLQDQPRFLFFCMAAATHLGLFEGHGNKSTIAHLTGEALRAHRFPFPPIDEQQTISQYLDQEAASGEALTTQLNLQITRLHEYRQSLITAAVTGQIDVRSDSMAGIPLDAAEEVNA